jgi:eukaryotic-like serine/threonine-protein kinase
MSSSSDRSDSATTGDGARAAPASAARKADRPSLRPGGPESLVGTTLSGRYLIERLIGEGGMGAVYQAEHTHMRKRLAVKVLHAEMSRMSEVVARFEREAMAAAHIDHPNVAAATDFGKLEDGSFFLVLEYVEGKSLRELIAKGPIDVLRSLRVMRQVASALSRAHGLGIVHRDLKPENVMLVAREDEADFVKVLDFGIAKVPVGDIAPESKQGAALTQLGMVYGTPEYMAPEQALGQDVDARADLYSVGVIAYEMLTGSRPFEDESKVKLLGMHVTAAVPPMATKAPGTVVPAEVEAIVSRLLAKEASDRYADARGLVDAIDGIIGPSVSSPQLAITSQRSIPDASGPSQSIPMGPPTSPGQATAMSSLLAPKVIVALGSLAGLVVFIIIAVVLVRNASRGEQTTVGEGGLAFVPASHGTNTAPTLTVPDTKADDAVKLATTKLSSGDADGAIAILTKVEAQSPARGDVHKQLYLAYMQTSNPQDAMAEAGKWLDADDKALKDVKLPSDVKAVASGGKDGSEAAFGILETKLGAAGPDILYDLAYGTGTNALVAARARKSLAKPDVQKVMSPALDVTLDIKNTSGCESVKSLFGRAKDAGDERTVSVLRTYQATRGCGFVGTRDCYPCMHKDGSLSKTIAAIQAKATP